ncbi:MAG: leucine-rich repeat protein [Bacteroidales bacterium]|nr:leucine-rich repeat protein [Bacteroidales bacterium]
MLKKLLISLFLCATSALYAANYLTFTAEEDGSSFGIQTHDSSKKNKSSSDTLQRTPDVQYSLDGGKTWAKLLADTLIPLKHKGDKALLRGNNPQGFSNSTKLYTQFVMTGRIAASGSVMSLIDNVGEIVFISNDYCFNGLFAGCTSLTKAPELPATTLASRCYDFMFYGCTSLTKAPKLPATTLKEECYYMMFYGCTSLTKAPKLPATILDKACYKSMFYGCTSLTKAPKLPAITLDKACYHGMFEGCISLTKVPELPATTLKEKCYYSMFERCTSLTKAPKLPATTLASGCYGFMFYGCTSLTQAPELPATSLTDKCYDRMFVGCSKIAEIKVGFTNWRESNNNRWNKSWDTDHWLDDVAPSGTFICPKTLYPEYGMSKIPNGWTVKCIDNTIAVETNYLTFTAEEDGSTFGIKNKNNIPNIIYSLDNGKTWNALTEGNAIMLAHKGDKALLRGNNPSGFSKDSYRSSFTMTGKIAASGSVMSLIDGVGEPLAIPSGSCFAELFSDCKSLTQAPELPATTLEEGCYVCMFRGCIRLIKAPELPATELEPFCYMRMFEDCTSLTKAPELPATQLADACYFSMFSGCTSLTQAPELLALQLHIGSYLRMFEGCVRLSKIKVGFLDWGEIFDVRGDKFWNTDHWFDGVAPSGTFICPEELPEEFGENRIPEGWKVEKVKN